MRSQQARPAGISPASFGTMQRYPSSRFASPPVHLANVPSCIPRERRGMRRTQPAVCDAWRGNCHFPSGPSCPPSRLPVREPGPACSPGQVKAGRHHFLAFCSRYSSPVVERLIAKVAKQGKGDCAGELRQPSSRVMHTHFLTSTLSTRPTISIPCSRSTPRLNSSSGEQGRQSGNGLLGHRGVHQAYILGSLYRRKDEARGHSHGLLMTGQGEEQVGVFCGPGNPARRVVSDQW